MGDDVILSVNVDDSSTDNDQYPMTYQWRKNGKAIDGETDWQLEIDGGSVVTNDAGSYTVVLNNASFAGCTVTSTVATVTVLIPATITSDITPLYQKVGTNKTATFTVKAIGTSPLHYLWMSNDVPIAGAPDTNVYKFMATNANQSGNYSVMVSNNLYFTVNDDSDPHDPIEEYDDTSSEAFLQVVAETIKPTLSISNPSEGTRWSNSVVTVNGTASDNAQVAGVYWYQPNVLVTNSTSTTNGWTNWWASFSPVPGTNIFSAFAIDTSGNQSTNAILQIFYVPSAFLTVQINGQGSISPNYNGALLAISNTYSMTATGTNGFAFTNWTGSFTTNSSTLTFQMQSNLSFTANFADVQKPTIAITNPAANATLSNAVAVISGWAQDNGTVTQVLYQVNGGAWTNAIGTTNWQGSVQLNPGTNVVSAYSVDAAGNTSSITNRNFIYILSAQLSLQITGKGTLSPNYSNAWLQIGKNYSITSAPSAGFMFTNWTGSQTTNNRVLTFQMQSNLSFTANFVDTNPPTIAITNPAANARFTNTAIVTVRGRASDNVSVTQVLYQVNSGTWANALSTNGWTNWTATITPAAGTNTVAAYALDSSGNQSTNAKLSILNVVTNPLLLQITGKGNPQSQLQQYLATDRQLLQHHFDPGCGFCVHQLDGQSDHHQPGVEVPDAVQPEFHR